MMKITREYHIPMAVIEEEFQDKAVHDKFKEHPVEGGKFSSKVTSTPQHRFVEHEECWHGHHSLVEKGPTQGFGKPHWVNLYKWEN